MTRTRGVLVVIGLIAGIAVAPTARVAACDCALTELPEAIRDADAAFVGVLAGMHEPELLPIPGGPAQVRWTWQVEWSRDPISADRMSVTAWQDDGANCGVAFAVGERWLVLGQVDEGVLRTNGCMRNQRIDGTDLEAETIIAALVTHSVAPTGAPTGGGSSVPMPVVVLLVGAAVLGIVSVAAFRRGAR